MGLLKQFEGMQLPAASELEWLVPEQDAPQKVGFLGRGGHMMLFWDSLWSGGQRLSHCSWKQPP